MIYDQPFPVLFRKDFTYEKVVPTLVNTNVGGHDEIARWVLDLNDVLYIDEPHAPGFHLSAVRKWTNDTVQPGPVLIKTDTLLYTTASIIQYLKDSAKTSHNLLPLDLNQRKEVLDLYHLFTGDFENKVFRYVCAQMLANPSVCKKVFTRNVPWIEKVYYTLRFPYLNKTLVKEMDLQNSSGLLPGITAIFQMVSDKLNYIVCV